MRTTRVALFMCGSIVAGCGSSTPAGTNATAAADVTSPSSQASPSPTVSASADTSTPGTTPPVSAPASTEPVAAGGPLTLEPVWVSGGFNTSWSSTVNGGAFVSVGESDYGNDQSMAVTMLDTATGTLLSTEPFPGASTLTSTGTFAIVTPDDETLGSAVYDLATGSHAYTTSSAVIAASPSHLILSDGTVVSTATGKIERVISLATSRVTMSADGIALIPNFSGDGGTAIDTATGLTKWTIGANVSSSLALFDDRMWIADAAGAVQELSFADGSVTAGPQTAVDLVALIRSNSQPFGADCGTTRQLQAGFYFTTPCSDSFIVEFSGETATSAAVDGTTTVPLTGCGVNPRPVAIAVVDRVVFCAVEATATLNALDASTGAVLASVPGGWSTTGPSAGVYVVSDGHDVVVTVGDQGPGGTAYGFRVG